MTRSGRIDRYVLRELVTPTLLGLSLYTFVLMMNHFFLVAEKSLSKNLGPELTMRMFLVGIPQLLVLAIPMATLLGTLIAMGRLSADHEWVALQSAGHGPLALTRPVLLHGLIAAVCGFLIYAILVPRTNYAFRNLRGEILFSSNLAADLKPRVFYDMPDGSVLFVEEISPGTQRRLEGVLIIQPGNEETEMQIVVARYGDIYPAPDRSGALVVDLYDGEARHYQSNAPENYQLTRFQSAEGRRIEPPRFVQSLLDPPEKVVQDFSIAELWDEMRVARVEQKKAVDGGESAGRLIVVDRRYALATVEFHQRLALPTAALLFALLALPLGITGVRSGKGAGFAMSLVVILAYRIVFVLSRNQAIEGNIPPALGPWVGNIFILIWAAWALRGLGRKTMRQPGLLLRAGTALAGSLNRLWTRRSARVDTANDQAATGQLTGLGGTPTRFVGRLDRYVGLAYLRVLVFSIISAYLIYGLVELQSLMDDVLRTQQPISLVFDYFRYFAPTVLHIVLPISCLVGAVVAITLLSRSGELVAIKAAGVGMRRVTVPVLFLTAVLSVVMFLVQDRIAPAAHRKAQTIKDQIEGRAPRTHGVPVNGRWSFGTLGEQLYHYRLYDPRTESFLGLSVLTLDPDSPRILDHRFGERARWNGSQWELEGGWHRAFGADEGYERYGAGTLTALDTPGLSVKQERRMTGVAALLPDQMSVAEIEEQIRTLQNSGYDITRLRMSLWGKFSQASAPLVMVLLGLPFAFRVGRRGSLYGIGVALLLVLVYWAAFAIFNALGMEAMLRPYVAAMAPNVLFGLLGTYLMLYIRT